MEKNGIFGTSRVNKSKGRSTQRKAGGSVSLLCSNSLKNIISLFYYSYLFII